MKAYQKPAMLVLSISANDMLCSGCDEKKLRDDPSLKGAIIGEFPNLDTDSDGSLSYDEGGKLFASSPDDCGQPIDYSGYCKFTGTTTLMWS